jgi:hypothetical protein
VPAAFEAEVLAGDAHPLEVLRGSKHPLDQLAVLVLDPPLLNQRPPRLGDALGKAIANRLQLAEVEDPRRYRNRVDPMRDLGVTEGLAEERGQLRLEAADLAPQLEPRLALVDSSPEPGELLVSQCNGHLQKCSQADSRVAAAIHNASSTAICGTPLTWTAATARRRVPCSTA